MPALQLGDEGAGVVKVETPQLRDHLRNTMVRFAPEHRGDLVVDFGGGHGARRLEIQDEPHLQARHQIVTEHHSVR